MVDQDTTVALTKSIRALIDLSELYHSLYQKQSKLHLRPADVPTAEMTYELSIPFEMLDRETQRLLDPYVETKPGGAGKLSKVEEKVVFGAEHVEKVAETLGLSMVDTVKMEELFNEFASEYDTLYQLLVDIFERGETVDVYYGTKYYVRIPDADHAFSIDDSDEKMFMMDYSTDDDIPTIYQIDWDDTVTRAIRTCCYSEDDISFYSVY